MATVNDFNVHILQLEAELIIKTSRYKRSVDTFMNQQCFETHYWFNLKLLGVFVM
jgi:hypothetical protein